MKIKSLPKLVASLAIPQAAGAIGSFFTVGVISSWYASLAKPEFTPPNYLFGPVWTTLYVLMGISLYIIWTSKRLKSKIPLFIFGAQMALNALWSILFFGLKSPLLGLAGIIPLWVAVLLTIISFWKISKTAAYLLVPYIAWVSIATYLNWQILALN